MTDQSDSATFPLGQVVATPGALDALDHVQQSPAAFIRRHAAGDWGDVDAEDKTSNDHARSSGWRILSAYRLKDGTRLWVITEADRSVTTLLLPEEY
jgi:hypothetical protein